MEIVNKWITQTALDQLIVKLNQDEVKVFGPVKTGEKTEFKPISSLADTEKDYITTNQSAKSIIFPKYEALFQIIKEKGSIQLIAKELDKLPEIVLFGSRPCDARGLAALSTIFGGEIKDQIFFSRRAKTTLISVACIAHSEYCFCTSFHSGPGATEGSDILLTPDGKDNFFVEVITEKGSELVNNYSDCFQEPPEFDKASQLTEVPVAFEIEKILGRLGEKFEDDVWVEQSLRCIGCGSCAYVCPTCGCFDIQDVTTREGSLRKRSWDSCGFDLFTLHASGHNPRSLQSQRWRQRIFHKFQYMPESDQVAGCVGCGRCSKSCPVDMNLKTHLINLAKEL